MGYAGEDLGLDVMMDGGPRLWVFGRSGGEKGTKIAWFDV